MIELRDYQSTLTDQARTNIRAKIRRQVLVAPTGSGKTVIAAFIQGGAASRGLKTWFIVHRFEILSRTAETFDAVGIDYGVVCDGFALQPEKPVQLCMVGTLANRSHLLPAPNGIVWDECHHIVAGAHSQIAEQNPDAWQIGVTATPERLDGRGLRPFFDEMVTGPTTRTLMERGFLAPYRYFAPGTPDLAGGREGLNRKNTADIMGDAKLIGQAVDQWGNIAAGKRTINFELSRKASEATVQAFKTSGVSAIHVDGDMHPDARKEAFAGFAAGEYMILSNVAIAGEGVDIPAIEAVMLRDPTESLTKYLQEVGRGFRLFEGKTEAILLDFAGNAFRHGLPDDPRTWSLDGRRDREKKQRESDATPIRQCPTCYRISPSTVKVCPGCEYEHSTVWTPPQWKDGDLFELKRQGETDKEAAKKAAQVQRKAEERACGSDLAAWIRLGVTRKYTNPRGWALNQIKIRGDYAARFKRRA